MPSNDIERQSYPVVDMILNSVADWVNLYRDTTNHGNELAQCSADDVRQIASDLGVSSSQLTQLVAKGPHAADLLKKMLLTLKVDPAVIASTNPLVMRDLQWLCVNCGAKKRCRHEIAKGTAPEHFQEYCPNAMTLEALFKEKPAAAPVV